MEHDASGQERNPYQDYGLNHRAAAHTDRELLDQVAREQGLGPVSGPFARYITEILHPGEVDDRLDHQAVRLKEGVTPRSAPSEPGAYYPGIPHEELHRSVNTEVDPGVVGEIATTWTDLGNAFTGFTQSIAEAITASEADWVGTAGDGARQALADLGNRAGETGVSAQLAGTLFTQQSRALADARNSVPPPPERPFDVREANDRLLRITDPLELVRQAAADREAFEQQQEAHREAARVVETYDRTVAQTAAAQPAFAPPPVAVQQQSTAETPVGTGEASSRRGAPVSGVPEVAGVPGISGTTGTSATPSAGQPGADKGDPVGRVPGGGVTQPSAGSGPVAEPLPGRHTSGPGGGVPGGGAGVGVVPGGRAGGTSGGGGKSGGAAAGRGGAPRIGGPGAGGPGVGKPGVGGPAVGGPAVGGPGGGSGVGAPGSSTGARGSGTGGAGGGRGPGGVGGAAGLGGVGGVGGAPREEDVEHRTPSYLVEPDPDDVFGASGASAPPVIGDWDQ
ncbi:hypothetical protein ABZ816_30195 [Actinosynnema sp. NPDC047251]|uniref:PPE family domain-containing protein n=1 Tax=Saccharothrix espanaensis (strain ATCC 51144 / DSM 44229 / JCM 9112 / NBRC 15066 / NRRL 15764) TaxID=1179773 RepID=K0KD01_SACES|nr:hypothetical protein [Saccharothrix espanaensis]CCH34649.1 hypothetical protein BN6_74200 [Saccharothrix espanaensis DSM 44229]